MRILGPNCLGLFTAHVGFYGCFSNTLDRALPTPGPLSIVSQSGAFGTHLYYLARERGLGLRYWVSTGNEADVQAAECLSAVVDDPETKVVILYLEGARDGRALLEALEKARRARKPVIAIKVGRSAVGAAAAASHTAALAGGDAVYDAMFRDYRRLARGVGGGGRRSRLCRGRRHLPARRAPRHRHDLRRRRHPHGRRRIRLRPRAAAHAGGGAGRAARAPPVLRAAQSGRHDRPGLQPRWTCSPAIWISWWEGRTTMRSRLLHHRARLAAIRPALKAALEEPRAGIPTKLIVLSMLVPPELFAITRRRLPDLRGCQPLPSAPSPASASCRSFRQAAARAAPVDLPAIPRCRRSRRAGSAAVPARRRGPVVRLPALPDGE